MSVIPRERLVDLLVTAAEGGSNYWASFTHPRPAPGAYDTVRCREHEPHSEDVPAVDLDVTALDLVTGLQRIAAAPDLRRHLIAVLEENDDAETADVVMQMTLFGEVIYG